MNLRQYLAPLGSLPSCADLRAWHRVAKVVAPEKAALATAEAEGVPPYSLMHPANLPFHASVC